MNIDLILSRFSSLLLFFCYAATIAIGINHGDYAFTNPKNSDIKVKDLRALLDKRGLLYHDFNEESEYINALMESGPLTVGELKMARNSNSDSILSDDTIKELVHDITFGGDALENVLNSKDEIWLVRIEPNAESRTNILEETVWRRLKKVLGSFEVTFGRFDCKKAPNYCSSKGWSSRRLILVVPRLHKSTQLTAQAKAYTLKMIKAADDQWVYETDSVVKQVYERLDGKLVHYLPNEMDFGKFLSATPQCSVHFLLLTNLRHCPFMLSALAAMFNTYGIYCFGYGPRMIAKGILNVPDNQDGAVYAIKSRNFYGNTWQIIQNNQSIDGKMDDMLKAMVTFESLNQLLNKYYSPPPSNTFKPPSSNTFRLPQLLTKNTYSNSKSSGGNFFSSICCDDVVRAFYTNNEFRFSINNVVLAILHILASAFKLLAIGLSLFVIVCAFIFLPLRGDNSESRRTEEFARYLEHMSNRNQSNEQNIWRIVNLLEDQNEAYLLRSATTNFSRLNNNEEFPLRSVDYLTVSSLRVQYLTNWHKHIFKRYNLDRMVSQKMRTLLAHYGVDVEEIGFPPYNWILRLPAVEISGLSEDNRLSECPICQYSIADNDNRLCYLPCTCKDIVYHYDCIAPWLIKREDPNSHSFISGKLHTERPCPTCRFDVTNWGLRQIFNA